MIASSQESYDKPRQYVKKRRRHFTNKGPYNRGYDFASSHVWMRAGPSRRQSAKELMILNSGA